MAVLTITISDAVANRVTDAICIRRGYDPLKNGTKAAFVKSLVIDFLKAEVSAQETGTAAALASIAAAQSVLTDILIT